MACFAAARAATAAAAGTPPQRSSGRRALSAALLMLAAPALLVAPAAAQSVSVLGSREAAQAAADQLVFFLQAPGNCLQVNSDLPASAPSKNLAALWIRAVFHDAGTWVPTGSPTGGANAGIMSFLNQTENGGIADSIAPKFQQNTKVSISKADAIALGGVVSVAHCGGPSITYSPGRVDTTTPANPTGRLPSATEAFDSVLTKLRRMGWSNEDIVALVTGSHTMGGVHGAITPEITNKPFVPFDTTPGVFDNDVFKRSLAGKCVLPVDCSIAKDATLRPIVEKYANDQQAFFTQYAISFAKLMGQTNDTTLLPSVPVTIALHKNLFAEGTTDENGNVLSGSSTTAAGSSPTNPSKAAAGEGSVVQRCVTVAAVWAAGWFLYSRLM
nr:L-ascorbate peroxidase 3 [Polyrhizophydium stewartii]